MHYDLLDKFVEDPCVELLEVSILPDQREEHLHIVIDLFAGGDGLRQRFLCLQQGNPLLLVGGHHGLVPFLGDFLQRPVLIELAGDLLQFAQPLLCPSEFPPLSLGILPLLGLLGDQEHLGVVPLRHRRPSGVAADVLQYQCVQRLPADGVGGAAGLAVVLIDPAGKAGVTLSFSIIAEIEGGTAVGALDQPSKGLDFVVSILTPPGLHHLVDGVPQLTSDQRLVGTLGDDPLLLRGGDASLIKEAIELGAAKHELPQIDRVVEDGSDGGGVPVIGLAPVFTLEVVWVILIEVCLGIEDASLPENLGHPHIANAVGEHLEDVPHHIGGGWVYDEVMPVGGVLDIVEGSVAAQVHPGLGSGPMGGLGFTGGLPGIEGVDHIGEWENQAVQALL